MKSKKNINPIMLNWGEGSKSVYSQNAMSDNKNPYAHITLDKEEKVEESNDFSVLFRGACNHAPQKDILLGRRSITHKSIAEKLAVLNAGKGIEFYIEDPEDPDNLTDEEQLEILYAEDIKKAGLADCIKGISNGLTYQNLASIVATQNPKFNTLGEFNLTPEYFTCYPSERLRYSKREMNDFAEEVVNYHFYHKNWGFDPKRTGDKEKANTPQIVSIEDYISKSKAKKADDLAFAVPTSKNAKSEKGRYVSFPFVLGEGIFDNAYPLASWKTESSINDIQSEFESSCIRIDYLRNGLHVFAVVNVYALKFNDLTENQKDESAREEFAEKLSVVKALKGSYASGRILVNPIPTTDPEKDGVIEINEIKLSFDVNGARYFNEESRSAILTAWGVMADLFSVSKPEKNNLRSQGEFLKIGILLLHERIRMYQSAIEKGINNILSYYGLEKAKARVIPLDSNVYLSVMSEFAAQYMDLNEVREKILNLSRKDKEELDLMLQEKNPNTNINVE